MKRLQVKLENIYALDVPDDFDYAEPSDVQNILFDFLKDNNTTAENEFFENLIVVCSECGISLSTEEELLDGMCAQCSATKN
jgi:hypothetical protein